MSKLELPRLLDMNDGHGVPPEVAEYGVVLRWLSRQIDAVFKRSSNIIGGELSFGNPDDGPTLPSADTDSPTARLDNMAGAWATARLTSAAQLGNGASAPVVFTHGLNRPVQSGGGAANPSLPNVLPFSVTWQYGTKFASSVNPTAPANGTGRLSVYWRAGDPVTADTIALRVDSGITPSSTNPLRVVVFFVPITM